LYTPFALEATENQEMINATFVGQAQGDIRQKLQKLEGFAGMNSSQLLEVATKTFVNQDQEARQEADKKMKKKSGPPFSSPC
jgi:replication-associated recombination protein RarA